MTAEKYENQTGESSNKIGQNVKKLWNIWKLYRNHNTYVHLKLAEFVMSQ